MVRASAKRNQGEVAIARLAAIVESSYDAIISEDLNSVVTSWNPAAERLFGYSAAEMIGQPITRIIPSELHDEEDRIIKRIHADGCIVRYETKRVAKNGRAIDVDLTISPIKNTNREVIGAAKIVRDISDRKAAEAQAAQLAAIVESTYDAIISKDLNSVVVTWNPGAERPFGYSAAEMIGQPIARLIPADLQEEEDRLINQVRSEGAVVHYLTKRVAKDGRLLDVSLTLSAIRNGVGVVIGDSKIARDVSERKQAGAALQESEERLRFALANARAGAWRWNVDSGEVYWSPEVFALHGLDPGSVKLTYLAWLARVHPEDRAKAKAIAREAFAKRAQDYRIEYRVPLSPSGTRWLLGVGRFESAGEASAPRMSGIIFDVTEQKQTEIALRASEVNLRRSQTHLRYAADAARLTYGAVDLATGQLSVDENFKRVMGFEPIAQPGHHSIAAAISSLVRDREVSPRTLDAVQALLDGRAEVKLEYKVQGDDGFERSVESVWSVDEGSNSRPERIFVTNLDITSLVEGREALAEAKSEAERANLSKSKFLASASHDLRQPVQSLVLLLAVAEKQVKKDARATRTIDMMKHALGGLSSLLSAILDISRLDAGAIQPSLEVVHLGPLFDRLMTEYLPKASARGLGLRVVNRDCFVRTDPVLFERALRNLVENALRYTKNGGILLGIRHRGGDVRVDVVDTGIGIPSDKHAEIFEEFLQLHNPGRDLDRGVGLGLAIVARLSTLLGIKVEVSSRPGRGSRFSLTLPLAQAEVADVEELDIPRHAQGAILIVEDNVILRESLEEVLKSWGYGALAASGREDALTLSLEGFHFDAIVTDYALGPGPNGIEVALEIEHRLGRALPKLVLTGDASQKELAEYGAGLMNPLIFPDSKTPDFENPRSC